MCLFTFSLLSSIALAVTGSLTFWKVTEWYHFYIPVVLLLAGYLAAILLWWIFADLTGRILCFRKKYDKVNRLARFIMNDSMRYICFMGGVRMKMTGKHLIPNNERFLFVSNHVSKFDPLVVNAYLGKYDIAFITKPSNYKIPLAKRLMPSLFYQAIDREDPIQSLGVMKRSGELIENKITSIGVYPEGTRHQDNVLGNFHEGVFNICIKAKCPLVIATTTNTHLIHKNFPFKLTPVHLDIIQVIPYEQLEGKTAKTVSDEVKILMERNLAKYN